MSERALMDRAGGTCELCASTAQLTTWAVPPHDEPTLARGLVVCGTCATQLTPGAALDAAHWACLQDAAWSQEPAIQVIAWRLLRRLDAPFAAALLDQLYLPAEVLAWAESVDGSSSDSADAPTLDSNGALLVEGDSVILIKDLNVRSGGFTAKRGTMVRRIRLTDDPANIEGKINGSTIVLKTCFLKKA